MNGYLNYFIEANIGLVLFLTAYALLLRNETDFQIKRYFLLIGIFTSLTFPLLHIQYGGTSIPTLSRVIPSYLLPEFTITGDGTAAFGSRSRRLCQGWMVLSPGALCWRIALLFSTVHRSAIQPAADDQKF